MDMAAPVAPLATKPLLVFLLAFVVLLLLARLLGSLAERLGLPAIVGELMTGVVLGPSLLGHLAPGVSGWMLPAKPDQMHLIDAVGQLGVLLLVGITGTHLDVGLLRRQAFTATAVSVCGLVVPLSLGVAMGLLVPASLTSNGRSGHWVFAVFLGVAMCVSAIPVIAKTLSDMRLLHRNVGQLTLAAGMIDDAVGWLLLSVVSAAATVGARAARSEEPGPTVAAAVIVVLLGAVVTQTLGLEPVFGAFVAGILIATARPAQVRLAPLRTVVLSVLAPLFLATAGLRMDLTALARPAVAVTAVAVLAVAIAGKFVGAYTGARLSRLSPWEGLALGAGMNARGVIEVIVALIGLRLGVLNTATYTIVVLVAIVTSLMAPPLLRLAMARVASNEDERLRKIDHDLWRGADPRSASTSSL